MNRTEILMSPIARIEVAKDIILKIVPTLDQTNIFGIVGFGSFWSPDIQRKPNDIDLAIYIQNHSVFIDKDKSKIVDPLTKTFGLPIEPHLLSPYTPSVTHELENFKKILKNTTLIWGKLPNWF